MDDKDIQRLMDLVQEGLKHPPTKEEALALFVRAGIMDEDGNLTPYFKILEQE